jgi:hypothetical protein
MTADPGVIEAITIYQNRMNSGFPADAARREIAAGLLRVVRPPKAPAAAAAAATAAAAPAGFPVSALVNLAELLRQNDVIDTPTALGLRE